MSDVDTGWAEDTSDFFIRYGHLLVPHRWEQISTIASLVPARRDERFVAVELACGAGVLSGLILRRFPRCRVLALDGSPAMLRGAAERLAEMGDRVTFRQFDLKRTGWLDEMSGARCVVSSLAVHHLDGLEKRELFAAVAERLEPGGALLISDLIEPITDCARALFAAEYEATVRDQSIAFSHSIDPFRRFIDWDWNHFRTPDVEFDKPSGLFEQLQWLREAGFEHVDCFWLRAGHAVYGGYKAR